MHYKLPNMSVLQDNKSSAFCWLRLDHKRAKHRFLNFHHLRSTCTNRLRNKVDPYHMYKRYPLKNNNIFQDHFPKMSSLTIGWNKQLKNYLCTWCINLCHFPKHTNLEEHKYHFQNILIKQWHWQLVKS